jgi:pimeloyl-ACP methyl ester carboxylesterase
MPHKLIDPPAHPVHEGSVHSADGTRIAFTKLGEGPPIIFIHGSISHHVIWMPVARLLAPSFTCFVVDRRGRSKSGHGNSPYSMDRECEDLAAVMAVAGPGATLVGHSYGAICALEAALRMPVSRMVIYEPPIPVGGPIAGEYLAPYAEAVQRGDTDAAIQLGLARFSRMPDAEIVRTRESRGWPRLCAMASTWIDELKVMDALNPNVSRYEALPCPVLLLEGSESPEHPLRNAARALAALPGVRLETLAGHDHVGMRTAPALVASLISDFVSA